MIDPVEAIKKHTSAAIPMPTVIPGNTPVYQEASATGERALW